MESFQEESPFIRAEVNGLSWLSHEWLRCLEWIDPVRFYKWSQGQACSAPINTNLSALKTTKRQVLADFRLLWQEAVESTPSLRGDSIAKREEFNNYVDALNKDGIVTDSQAFNWSNPF